MYIPDDTFFICVPCCCSFFLMRRTDIDRLVVLPLLVVQSKTVPVPRSIDEGNIPRGTVTTFAAKEIAGDNVVVISRSSDSSKHQQVEPWQRLAAHRRDSSSVYDTLRNPVGSVWNLLSDCQSHIRRMSADPEYQWAGII